MMQSIALNPAFRTRDRLDPKPLHRSTPVPRPMPPAALPDGAVIDLDDPRDGARAVIVALLVAVVVAFLLATLLATSTPQSTARASGLVTTERTVISPAPAFGATGPTASIPTGPVLLVMLTHGQD